MLTSVVFWSALFLVGASECPTSYVYCSPHPTLAWVDGLAGCQQFFADQGGLTSDAVCEDGRCKNTCGLNNCDLNDACVAGVCYNGCATGGDCKAGNVYTKCNNYLEFSKTYEFPTVITGPNITYTNFTLTYCLGFCSMDCARGTGYSSVDTCDECITGTLNCLNNDWCDFFGQLYVTGISGAFYPGDPVFNLSAFQKRRCESNCEYDIGDARAGIYVNRITSDITSITNMDPIPAPGGRMPIVQNGTVIHALPGRLVGTKTCVVPVSNAECANQDKYGLSYRANFVTQMDFGTLTAAYCSDECPRFAGHETVSVDTCRECSSFALNRCQWRFPSGGRDTCDAFAKFLPGDPYGLVGWNICTETCLGAVNGSGWAPCGGGGCCDRCDIDQLNCLWGCSVGPKCEVDAFASGLNPSDLVGACVPMCDDVTWTDWQK